MASPITATPLPVGTAIPDVPADLAAAVNNLEKFLVPRYTDATARDNAIPLPIDGQLVYTAGVFQKNVGGSASGWTDLYTIPAVPAMATGLATVSIAASASNSTAAVTFPTGRFATSPNVILTVNSSSGSAINSGTLVYSLTANGCTVGLYLVNTLGTATTYNVLWLAVERGF